MPDTQIRIEGAQLVRRNLRKVQTDLPRGMRLIHQEIAEPLVHVARRRARKLTGRMAGTIRPSATTTMAQIQAGPLIYLPVQYWGWPGHNIEPNRFLIEAFDERTDETLRLYEKKLSEWIDSVWVDSS